MSRRSVVVIVVISVVGSANLACAQAAAPGNQPDRLEWFHDLGFGMFIHWSMDSQLGSVISHSMVAADEGYLKRFVEELPRTFNPRRFEPEKWADLAKLAGMRYVVFTTKHHSGFCMFPSQTTDFDIEMTPFQRDITAAIVKSFRDRGVAPGFYFSPDDFWWLYKNGITVQRGIPEVQPGNNPGLMDHDKAQVRELLTGYGPIDVLFFDGEAAGLRELAWELQPQVVVTRGAMETPEQYIPGIPLEGAWEACLTMGTQWQYKPTNEQYKSGGELISLLVETRAKGGNLLLNVGPTPEGEIPVEQEERLREVALWMFVNSECIYGVRPWVVTNEGETWFTRRKGENTLYAIVKWNERWKYGEWREILLKSVRVTPKTEVRILGQNDKVLEYQPNVLPKTTWQQAEGGVRIRAMRAQRLYNDRKWPNPVVLKLTNVEAALAPPQVVSLAARWEDASRSAVAEGEIVELGDAPEVEVGFEYRDITGMDTSERAGEWTTTRFHTRRTTGRFVSRILKLASGHTYEIRAVVKHPLLTLYGRELRLRVEK